MFYVLCVYRYDEVIVGAHIFSSVNDLEIGRVYIFENAGVSAGSSC